MLDDPGLILPPCLSGGRGLDTAGVDSGELVGVGAYRCADVCFRLFARGTELAARRGLILADTKYELGLLGDEIVLIDEVHTPDSSRYWYADTYDELFRKDKDQRALDKEPLQEWMAERGFRGDGEAPVFGDPVDFRWARFY